MTWQYTPYLIPLALTAVISLLLALYASRRRQVSGAEPLMLFMLGAAEWSLCYAMELGGVELSTKIFWAKFQYFGIVLVAWMMLVMVLQYTGYDQWASRKVTVLLSIVPLLTLLMVWTNEYHHLIWAKTELLPVGNFTILAITHGIGFWLIIGYSYLCLAIGMLLLFLAFRRSSPVYRAQVGVMLAGSFAPWLGNFLYVAGLIPLPYLDLTPFAFTLTGIAATWGMFRFHLLDIVPVARDAVIEDMRGGVIVLDRQGRVIDLNPAGEKMLGVSLDSVTGILLRDALAVWPALVSLYEHEREAQVELVREDALTPRWFEVQMSSLSSRQERWIGRLIVFRDITERKLAEQERERLIAELDAFAHTVAHDLKNPLTAITGFIQFLHSDFGPLDDGARDSYVRTIQHSANKMYDIIEALLLLSSVQQHVEVALMPLDMAYVTSEAIQRLDLMIQEYEATLIMPETWETAVGYMPWVEEVWVNYISNALKYGGRPPRVELGSERLPDGQVRFWVRDNGTGIPEEMRAQLFIPFSRLNKDVAEGHGLGLSIVQRILERLDGEAALQSSSEQGSVFSFTLLSVHE